MDRRYTSGWTLLQRQSGSNRDHVNVSRLLLLLRHQMLDRANCRRDSAADEPPQEANFDGRAEDCTTLYHRGGEQGCVYIRRLPLEPSGSQQNGPSDAWTQTGAEDDASGRDSVLWLIVPGISQKTIRQQIGADSLHQTALRRAIEQLEKSSHIKVFKSVNVSGRHAFSAR
jgi:hypothetical protein